jgi:hypothetical protein
MFFLAPMLWGAGLGALGGLLTKKNPFETALIGAALGTGAGALGAGAAGTTAGSAGLASGAGTAAGGTGIALGDIAASKALADTALAGSNLASGIGAGTGIGGAAGTGVQLANAGGGLLGFNPISAAQGASGISNLGQYATGVGTDLMAASPTLYDRLKPYATIDNLSGAANIMSKFQPKQPSPAPQGRVSQGQAPAGGLGQGGVEGLLAELEKQRQTQRQPISLLVG